MKSVLLKIFVFLLITQYFCTAQSVNKVATVGFVFLELPASARYMSLGETGIALPNYNAEGLFINPALIALNKNKFSINVTYAKWYVETSHQALGMSYQFGDIGTFGLQVIYFDFGEIEKTQNQTVGKTLFLGTYSANAYSIGLTYAKNLTQQFTFGFTAKYVRETIDQYFADNLISDIGFIYETGFESLRIGASLQNFGLESKYIEEKFKMPQLLKLGISGEVWGSIDSPNHVSLIIEAAHPNDVGEHLQVGIENVWMNVISLRFGYKFGYEFEDLTLGLGLQFQNKNMNIRFGAAYMKHDYLDKTMRYTLSLDF